MNRSSCYPATILALALALNGCATLPKSLLLGAGMGGVAGGTTGYFAGGDEHHTRGSLIGLGVGAAVGGLAAYLIHKGAEKDSTSLSSDKKGDAASNPLLTRPEVRMMWVPDKIEGNRYIEKHRVFIIEKNSTWGQE